MSDTRFVVRLELDAEGIRAIDPVDHVGLHRLGMAVWGAFNCPDGDLVEVSVKPPLEPR